MPQLQPRKKKLQSVARDVMRGATVAGVALNQPEKLLDVTEFVGKAIGGACAAKRSPTP
jgi:hypothetical protein